MRVENQRPSDNFQDRGSGSSGGGVGAMALFGLFRLLGFRGLLIAIVVLGAIYLFNPFGLREAIFGALVNNMPGQTQTAGSGSACAQNEQACDFSRRILGSTETVWARQFQDRRLPNYGSQVGAYENPTLVVYSGSVQTDGCGAATSAVGPFYCPNDGNLYIDPSFYQVMAQRLQAPGDFAQAYVIAHEVGHHVQKLIGAMSQHISGESENQTSVRTELQADCLAGVWGHTAQAALQIDDADLREALNAAHSIGDDALGADRASYTHGASEQRMRWFRRGFDSGDSRQCDTWSVANYNQL
jgi:predicted metalloprotease